jgi:DNA-binding XRE family transcriptional regulator
MANLLGINSRTYYNWIKEESDIPSSALIKMSKIFNVTIDYLLKA